MWVWDRAIVIMLLTLVELQLLTLRILYPIRNTSIMAQAVGYIKMSGFLSVKKIAEFLLV